MGNGHTRQAAPNHWVIFEPMSDPLTASDLWLLILKLPHDESVRLAKLALHAAAGDALPASAATPPTADELSAADELLSWEAQGWEDSGAPRL